MPHGLRPDRVRPSLVDLFDIEGHGAAEDDRQGVALPVHPEQPGQTTYGSTAQEGMSTEGDSPRHDPASPGGGGADGMAGLMDDGCGWHYLKVFRSPLDRSSTYPVHGYGPPTEP